MDRYDLLYELYESFDTDGLRDHQRFIDVFPPVDSRVALEGYQEIATELDERKGEIRDAFQYGETLADIAAHASREEAFTALDLLTKHDRGVNVLVLDVDETLRSAGGTDNEIPRETLHYLTELHEAGIPVVICTGQTLENVKGFAIQGLGSELVHSGTLSIVYEAGTGVFTPGHGSETKKLLYERLDERIQDVFYALRSRVLPEAPDRIREGCHLQGNEFNVTLKPNAETGSPEAEETIDRALCYLVDLLGTIVTEGTDSEEGSEWARAFYAAADPEIRGVLERRDRLAERNPDEMPAALSEAFERIDVAYYEADAAEVGSLELNKVAGVEAAFDVLGVDDPFALVMGDSKSDLRVMEWVADGKGIAAAPEHASRAVLDHVIRTDELVFDRGEAAAILRIVSALNRLATLD
ncbi:HAD family hydrolase [Halococcus morrhuae DSM 1307]|uniref:HAD family hydrolase n=1 Tax=Halococcus morrhuae TaxID=2250 RepID=UPI003F865A38